MNNQEEFRGEFSTTGKLYISGEEKLNEFGLKNTGKRVLITIRTFEKKSSPAFIGYYRNKFLPEIQRAYMLTGIIKSISSIDKELRYMCPITVNEKYNEKKKIYETTLIELEDLEKWQIETFINSFLRPWAHENLNVYIDPTITL